MDTLGLCKINDKFAVFFFFLFDNNFVQMFMHIYMIIELNVGKYLLFTEKKNNTEDDITIICDKPLKDG